MSVWEGLEAQEGAVALLRRDIDSGRVAHAYLFAGAAGRMPRQAAEAFAAALVCPSGGCGACDRCRWVTAGAHPDVELVEPPGMQLLVEQVRDAVRAAWRKPVEGSRRVIVVDRADRMNPNAQNAFLKALEEPPPSTTVVLLAPSVDALLETVRSRCREIAFRTPGATEIARILASSHGLAPEDARRWALAGGTLDRARVLATDPGARGRRDEVRELVLRGSRDPGEAVEAADRIAARAREVRDGVAEAHTQTASERSEWLKETRKASDDRLRREQRRAEQDALESALDDVASVLRDLVVIAQDTSLPLLNEDLREPLAARAAQLGARAPLAALAGLAGVEKARRRLAANANVQLALEHVFLTLLANMAPTSG